MLLPAKVAGNHRSIIYSKRVPLVSFIFTLPHDLFLPGPTSSEYLLTPHIGYNNHGNALLATFRLMRISGHQLANAEIAA